MTVLWTSELHDRVRSVQAVRFDYVYFVCACESEAGVGGFEGWGGDEETLQ